MADEASLSPDHVAQVAQAVAAILRPDILRVMEASARLPPSTPATVHPPVKFEGLDPQQRDQLKRELLIEAKEYVRGEIEDFLPDTEIEERIKRGSESVARQIETLKADLSRELRTIVHDEVAGLRSEFFEIFDDMDMPLDKGPKRKETREKLEGLFAMHRGSKEFKSELWKSIRAAIIGQITIVILGALAFFGFKTGGGH